MRKAGLLVLLLLASCEAHDSHIRPLRPLEIAVAPYREGPTVALAGSLMYEGGCLLFREDRSKAQLLPVWPYGPCSTGRR